MECPIERRFTDMEIILYLLNRVSRRQVVLPFLTEDIPTIDIFENQDPHETFNRYADDREICFLTNLHKRNADTVRKWKRGLDRRTIEDRTRNTIGTERGLIYDDDCHGKKYFLREYIISDWFNDIFVRFDCRDIAFCVLIKREAALGEGFLPPLRETSPADELCLQNILKANTIEYVPFADDFIEEFDFEYLWNFRQALLDLFGPF